MAETFCVKHSGKTAVGYCSKCNKSYCEECLDMETGKPVCHDCLKGKAPSSPALAAGAPPLPQVPAPGGSPLNFKGKGLDDDPLGLFGAGGPKVEVPKLTPTPPPFKPPVMPPPKPVTPPTPKPLTPSMPSLDQLGAGSPLSEKIPGPAPKSPMDLDSLIKEPQPLRPPFPQVGTSSPPVPAPFSSPSMGNTAGPAKKADPLSAVKQGAQATGRRVYGLFDDLAVRLRVPLLAVVGLAAVLAVVAVVWLNSSLNQTAVPLVDSIQPIHFVQVNAGQVGEMDVTAYAEVQNQIQTMGFQPVIQMTVPQLAANFFDVSMKQDAGAYSEIIKMPGQLAPRVSFVTVFTNGVWFSTNAWQGINQNLDYLVSEFYPNDTPDQLWVQHMQTLAKLKQDKGWEVQAMGENRYMAAFADHLRWFLDKKGIPSYQADFNLWL